MLSYESDFGEERSGEDLLVQWIVYLSPLRSPKGAIESSQVIHRLGPGGQSKCIRPIRDD